MRLATYVYTGWHPIPERDASFHPGFTEWELLRDCRPTIPGQHQPRVPLLGEYDDRDPTEVGRRIRLARDHGIDAFVFGVFWCRGKRVFEAGLDQGFLGSAEGATAPFACMWANRMPRRVLPVRRSDVPVIDAARRVDTDVLDFERLIAMLATNYFRRPNYITVENRSYFSIFDSTFFVEELGVDAAREAIAGARAWLAAHGHRDVHLAAIDPNERVQPLLRELGFDSVTHYVLLPEWKGATTQDYRACHARRRAQWPGFAESTTLPYMPSVATGWDATPRGADFGPRRPDKYPWSPVVTDAAPQHFEAALRDALRFVSPRPVSDPLTFVASLNEWTEGHCLEPDTRFGYGWLEACRAAKTGA